MLCELEAASFPLGSEVRVQRMGLSGNTSVWGAGRGAMAVGGQFGVVPTQGDNPPQVYRIFNKEPQGKGDEDQAGPLLNGPFLLQLIFSVNADFSGLSSGKKSGDGVREGRIAPSALGDSALVSWTRAFIRLSCSNAR